MPFGQSYEGAVQPFLGTFCSGTTPTQKESTMTLSLDPELFRCKDEMNSPIIQK